MSEDERPATTDDSMEQLLRKLLRVPKSEIDKLEAERPKKIKPRKTA